MIKSKNLVLTLLACVLWGSAFPVLKTLYIELNMGSAVSDKFVMAGERFLIAGIMILAYYIYRYKRLPIIPSKMWGLKLFLFGFVQTGIMYMLFYTAVYNTTGVKSAILSQTNIFIIVILSAYIFQEKITRNKVIGLFIGFMGIIVLNINQFGGSANFWDMSFTGEGLLILSSMCGAMGTIIAKKFGKHINPILMTGWQMVFGATILLVTGLTLGGDVNVFATPTSSIVFLYSTVISSVAFTLWYYLLQHNKASDISVYKFMIPVSGAILSAIFIPGERFSVSIVVGLLLVCFGIYYCNRGSIKVKTPKMSLRKT